MLAGHSLRASLALLGPVLGSSAFVECGVSDYDDVSDAVAAADEFGGVDVMIDNAGIVGPQNPLVELDLEEYRDLLRVNLNSVVHESKVAALETAMTVGRSGVGVVVTVEPRLESEVGRDRLGAGTEVGLAETQRLCGRHQHPDGLETEAPDVPRGCAGGVGGEPRLVDAPEELRQFLGSLGHLVRTD